MSVPAASMLPSGTGDPTHLSPETDPPPISRFLRSCGPVAEQERSPGRPKDGALLICAVGRRKVLWEVSRVAVSGADIETKRFHWSRKTLE